LKLEQASIESDQRELRIADDRRQEEKELRQIAEEEAARMRRERDLESLRESERVERERYHFKIIHYFEIQSSRQISCCPSLTFPAIC
jgi:hypothetical protein